MSLVSKVRQSFAAAVGKTTSIRTTQLKSVLHELDPSCDIDSLLKRVDKDSKGVISYEEFIDFIFPPEPQDTNRGSGLSGQPPAEKRIPSNVSSKTQLVENLFRRQELALELSAVLCQSPGQDLPTSLVDATYDLLECDYVCLSLKEGYAEQLVYSRDANRDLAETPQWGCIIDRASSVWETGETSNILIGGDDSDSSELISKADGGYVVGSMLCMPLKEAGGLIFGVIQAVNRHNDSEQSVPRYSKFNDIDENLLQSLVSIASHQLAGHKLSKMKVCRAEAKFEALHALMKGLLTRQTFGELVRTILIQSRTLFECGRCCLYAVDNLKQELVGYQVCNGSENLDDLEEARFPIEGLVGIVVRSGELLNIPDAWADHRFTRTREIETGFRTRTLLMAPLITSNGRVIGVLQCVNKRGGEAFSADDETEIGTVSDRVSDVLKSLVMDQNFAAFFDSNNNIDSDVKDMIGFYHQKNTEADQELLQPHARNSARRVSTHASITSLGKAMKRLDFDHWTSFENGSTGASHVLACFEQMHLTSECGIEASNLRTCVNALQTRYHKNPYHNWSHAFSTFHFLFNLMTSGHLNHHIPPTDLCALFLAALGHDIEHPGYNNQFSVNSRQPLAIRYNDVSVLENHHASVTISVLENHLRGQFSDGSTASHLRRVITTAILATDMARHQEAITWLENAQVNSQDQTESSYDSESALKFGGVALHCADLSHPALPWELHQRISLHVAEEFYAQYHEEQRLGLPSLPFMGKDPSALQEIAPTQVGFIRFVSLPLWCAMERHASGDDFLAEALKNTNENIDAWQQIADGGSAS